MLLAAQQRVFVADLARGLVVARHLQLVAQRRAHHGTGQHAILDHLDAANRQRLDAILRLDREVTHALLCRAGGVAALRQRCLLHRHIATILLGRQVRDLRLVVYRRRRAAATATQQRGRQQRQPPQRHRCLADAQYLARLLAFQQHAHGIAALRRLRNEGVDVAVLVRTHQQVVAAFAVALLAVVLVIALDDQVRLVHTGTFKRHVQITAHAFGRHVLRCKTGAVICQVILHISHGLDAHRLPLGTDTSLATGDLQLLFRRLGLGQDAKGNVLDAHVSLPCPRSPGCMGVAQALLLKMKNGWMRAAYWPGIFPAVVPYSTISTRRFGWSHWVRCAFWFG